MKADMRLIDANSLPVHWGFIPYDTGIMQGKFVFMDDVDNAPTIDAVPVVRCWECKYRRSRNCPMKTSGSGSYIGHGMYDEGSDKTIDNGFCHMGVKMDGGAEG